MNGGFNRKGQTTVQPSYSVGVCVFSVGFAVQQMIRIQGLNSLPLFSKIRNSFSYKSSLKKRMR